MISVIVPALNEEKYIEDCLKSIKSSLYNNYEVVVVANGCNDKTVDIAKNYSDKMIELHDMGVSKARNAGAKIAMGEILVFIDADSIMSRNLLNRIDIELNKGYVGGSCNTWPNKKKIIDDLFWAVTNFISWIFKTPNGLSYYRKDVFFKLKGFNEEVTIGEDGRLLADAAKEGKIRFIKRAYIRTSMRRFEKVGYLKTIMTWISAFFFPRESKYDAVR